MSTEEKKVNKKKKAIIDEKFITSLIKQSKEDPEGVDGYLDHQMDLFDQEEVNLFLMNSVERINEGN